MTEITKPELDRPITLGELRAKAVAATKTRQEEATVGGHQDPGGRCSWRFAVRLAKAQRAETSAWAEYRKAGGK